MRSERGPVFWLLLAWMLFLATAGLGQVRIDPPSWFHEIPRLREMNVDSRALGLLAYGLGHLFLAGVGVPILLARCAGLAPGRPGGARGWDFWAGLALVAGGVLSRALGQDLSMLQSHPVALEARVLKAAFLLFPWAAAQALFAFFLFPRLIERLMGQRPLARAMGAAVAVLVLWSMAHVESRYGGVFRPDGGGAVWMALAAVGAVLSRSPLAAFALVFPVQVLAELSRGELAFLAWRPMLVAFLPAFWTATLFLAAHSPRRFPPKEAWSGPPPPAEEASDSQGQP